MIGDRTLLWVVLAGAVFMVSVGVGLDLRGESRLDRLRHQLADWADEAEGGAVVEIANRRDILGPAQVQSLRASFRHIARYRPSHDSASTEGELKLTVNGRECLRFRFYVTARRTSPRPYVVFAQLDDATGSRVGPTFTIDTKSDSVPEGLDGLLSGPGHDPAPSATIPRN